MWKNEAGGTISYVGMVNSCQTTVSTPKGVGKELKFRRRGKEIINKFETRSSSMISMVLIYYAFEASQYVIFSIFVFVSLRSK